MSEKSIQNQKRTDNEETQMMLGDIWYNYIIRYGEATEEEANNVYDCGIRLLNTIVKLALDERMMGEVQNGGFRSFESNIIKSICEILDENYTEYFYQVWRQHTAQTGRVGLEMNRDM